MYQKKLEQKANKGQIVEDIKGKGKEDHKNDEKGNQPAGAKHAEEHHHHQAPKKKEDVA